MGDPLCSDRHRPAYNPYKYGYRLQPYKYTASLLLLHTTVVQLPIFFYVVHVSFQGHSGGCIVFHFLPLG